MALRAMLDRALLLVFTFTSDSQRMKLMLSPIPDKARQEGVLMATRVKPRALRAEGMHPLAQLVKGRLRRGEASCMCGFILIPLTLNHRALDPQGLPSRPSSSLCKVWDNFLYSHTERILWTADEWGFSHNNAVHFSSRH